MNEQLTQFILSRVLADYIRLRDQGAAPDIEQYSAFWPEDPVCLIAPLLLEEFRHLYRQGQTPSTEKFLKRHPRYADENRVVLAVLEHELRSSPEDPTPEAILRRFPSLEENAVQELVERILFYRVWHLETRETVKRQPEAVSTDRPTDQATEAHEPSGGTEDFSPVSEPTDGTETFEPTPQPDEQAASNWGRQRDATVSWENDEIRGTLDFVEDHYREVVGETTNVPPKQAAKPTVAAPPPSSKAKLKKQDVFDVRDRLRIEDYVGSGAWKDVYKARQLSTKQLVAFKHLREKNDAECEALIREVRTQAQLTHQNIPPVFGFDKLDNGEAIVIEKLVDGSRWSDSMATRTLEDNLRILLEVGQAIAYAHRRHQLIHRDLKPDNVVVNDDFDEVYVIDWGLAVSVAPEPPEPRDDCVHVSDLVGIAGTPLYWAPEMARGETSKFSPASDVFLLGALLYEVLTGHPPYGTYADLNTSQKRTTVRFAEVGSMLRSVRGAVFYPKDRAPDRFIPDELAVIAMRAMAPEPGDRFVDGGEFVDAVKRYQRHAEATVRGDAAWKTLNSVTEEAKTTDSKNLHPLTLRLIELADTFRQVLDTLSEDAAAAASRILPDQVDPLVPAIRSAQQGELESRRLLFDVTMRTGDLTLATAQVDLIRRIPFVDAEELEAKRRLVDRTQQARRRARAMKWVAVALLLAFLGSSVLYGKLIELQYRKTEEERRRAEANFQSAREVVNQFLTDFAKDDSLKNLGLMPLQRKLLDSAKSYYELFVAQKSDDPRVLYEQMHALFDIAGIETRFGNYQGEVADYYRRAIDIGLQLTRKEPGNAEYLDLLAKCYRDLGVFYNMIEFDPDEIYEVNMRALAINQDLVEKHPETGEYRRNLARIWHNLGEDRLRRLPKDVISSEEFTEAENAFDSALAAWEHFKKSERAEYHAEYYYGKSQTLLAQAILYLAESETAEEKRAEFFDDVQGSLSGVDPEETRFQEAGSLFERRNRLIERAGDNLNAALASIKTLRTDFPDDYGITRQFLEGLILREQGRALLLEGRLHAAGERFHDALALFNDIVQKAPEDMAYQGRLNETSVELYNILFEENLPEEQLELCRRRVEELDGAVRKHKEVPDYVFFRGDWSGKLASTLREMGRLDEATMLLEKAVKQFEKDYVPNLATTRGKNADLAAQRTLDHLYFLFNEILMDEERFDRQFESAAHRKKELENRIALFPDEIAYRSYWCDWLEQTALALVYLERLPEAIDVLEKGVAELDRAVSSRRFDELKECAEDLRTMLGKIRESQ